MNSAREAVKSARRVVVKIGTNALTNATGRFDRAHFEALCDALSDVAERRELVVVSSGAIALGVERLGLASRPRDIPGKQACAAVGQSRLVQAYETAFERRGRTVAQVLLTHEDVQDRRRYLNARHTFARLLEAKVVPVVNENDTVSVAEIKFGDNDTLAGLVAGLVDADVLVVLSDVEGLYTGDPRKDPSARFVPEVREVTGAVLSIAGGSVSAVGTGGMATKVRAAAKVAEVGVHAVICSGQKPDALRRVLAGEEVGTLFCAKENPRSAREAWIAHALRPRGQVRVDDGARRAVAEEGRSLLPSGIREVQGEFQKGDPVDLLGLDGVTFARGLSAYDAEDLRRIAGKKSAEIDATLGFRYLDEAVHRDDLVLVQAG